MSDFKAKMHRNPTLGNRVWATFTFYIIKENCFFFSASPCTVLMYAATERAAAAVREPTDDELKFAGLNRGEIPSKSFQRLQSWTGTCKLYFIIIISG